MQRFVIATRQSKLALIQSEMIKRALVQHHICDVSLLPMKTTGDKEKDIALLEIGGKGLFTKEIENALLMGSANLAMHSLKDMPIDQPDGLMIGAVLKRDNPFDYLICADPCHKLSDLALGATIGTGSPRRAAQMKLHRPDIIIKPFRGNVPTRLRKLHEGQVDATILAAAGLERLNINPQNTFALPFIPAIGQGIVAIQCRSNDSDARAKLEAINHLPTWHQMQAERAFLNTLEGDCHSPIAGYAEMINDSHMRITGQILAEDGTHHFSAQQEGHYTDAEKLGIACANLLKPKSHQLWHASS